MNLVDVRDTASEKEFLTFPRQLYRHDPEFVSALDQDIKAIFNPDKNPYLQAGACKRWLLKEGNRTIGRIAAFHSSYKKDLAEQNIGGIGFFDCIHRQDAADLLFKTAEHWLREQGKAGMDGPINFGERDRFWGLLAEGFQNPSYMENYNAPYYRELFEGYGFVKTFEQHTSELTRETFRSERFERAAERIFNNPELRFEHFNRKALQRFAKDFVHIYNKAWQSYAYFSPMDEARVIALFKSMLPVVQDDLIWFVYARNEPAGFYVSTLEINQIFKHLQGNLNFWGKLKFLWYRRMQPITRARGIVFGIIPEWQNRGLETGLIMSFSKAIAQHPQLKSCELSWIGDFNPKMQSLFKSLGAQTTKIHYTYRKMFDAH